MISMEALEEYCEAVRKADALQDEMLGHARIEGTNPTRFFSRSEFDQIVVAAYAKPYRSGDSRFVCADVHGVTFCTLPGKDGR